MPDSHSAGATGRNPELPPGFQEVRWRSSALGRHMTFLLYAPDRYDEHPAKRCPVLYLLHGSGHDRHSVIGEVRPQEHVALLGETILVIPDGERGWWLDSPALPHSRYGEYVLELTEFVDRRYRTIADRVARGISGFSMGGYGAMLLASQHPGVFGAASSLLGPLDIVQMFPNYYQLCRLLGPELETWEHLNPAHLAEKLSRTLLRFCTAREAFDLPQNRAFADVLTGLGIPFEYRVYPGGHDTVFAREHIAEQFRFHRRAFDHGDIQH